MWLSLPPDVDSSLLFGWFLISDPLLVWTHCLPAWILTPFTREASSPCSPHLSWTFSHPGWCLTPQISLPSTCIDTPYTLIQFQYSSQKAYTCGHPLYPMQTLTYPYWLAPPMNAFLPCLSPDHSHQVWHSTLRLWHSMPRCSLYRHLLKLFIHIHHSGLLSCESLPILLGHLASGFFFHGETLLIWLYAVMLGHYSPL